MSQDFFGNYTVTLPAPDIIPPGTNPTPGNIPDAIAYPGPPVTNPPALQNIVVDSNGQQWQYWGGSWN